MAQTATKSKRQVKTKALNPEQGLEYYRQMVLIRRFEEKSAEMYARGKIGGFLHLYIGEEAVAVGAIAALEDQDWILSHYREHGHALARGMDPNAVMAELFGKITGCSKGKGGSMHLFDASIGFFGGSAIVGGQLPLATGLGLASKMRDDCKRVALCIIGDGAVQQGEFHESLNLAQLWKLPVVFLCENNGYGMGTPVEDAFAGNAIFERAQAYGMPGVRVDGMRLLETKDAVREACERARNGEGPSFVEAITYRFRGHSMADPVEYRQKSEEEEWKGKDPIPFWRDFILGQGVTEEQLTEVDDEIKSVVDAAVKFADESPFPDPEELYHDTYAPLEALDE